LHKRRCAAQFHFSESSAGDQHELSKEAAAKEEKKVLESLSEPHVNATHVEESLLLSVQSAFLKAGKTQLHPNRPCTFRKTKAASIEEAYAIRYKLSWLLFVGHELVNPSLGKIGDGVLQVLQDMSSQSAKAAYPFLAPIEATCNGTTEELVWNDADELFKQFEQLKLPIPEDATTEV